MAETSGPGAAVLEHSQQEAPRGRHARPDTKQGPSGGVPGTEASRGPNLLQRQVAGFNRDTEERRKWQSGRPEPGSSLNPNAQNEVHHTQDVGTLRPTEPGPQQRPDAGPGERTQRQPDTQTSRDSEGLRQRVADRISRLLGRKVDAEAVIKDLVKNNEIASGRDSEDYRRARRRNRGTSKSEEAYYQDHQTEVDAVFANRKDALRIAGKDPDDLPSDEVAKMKREAIWQVRREKGREIRAKRREIRREVTGTLRDEQFQRDVRKVVNKEAWDTGHKVGPKRAASIETQMLRDRVNPSASETSTASGQEAQTPSEPGTETAVQGTEDQGGQQTNVETQTVQPPQSEAERAAAEAKAQKEKDDELMQKPRYKEMLTSKIGQLTADGAEPDGEAIMRVKGEILKVYKYELARQDKEQEAKEKQKRLDQETKARKQGIHKTVLTEMILEKGDDMIAMNPEERRAFYADAMDRAVELVQIAEAEAAIVTAPTTEGDAAPQADTSGQGAATETGPDETAIAEGNAAEVAEAAVKNQTPAEALQSVGIELNSVVGQDLLELMNANPEMANGIISQLTDINTRSRNTASLEALGMERANYIQFMIENMAHKFIDQAEAQAKESGEPIDTNSKLWKILQYLLYAAGAVAVGLEKVVEASVQTGK